MRKMPPFEAIPDQALQEAMQYPWPTQNASSPYGYRTVPVNQEYLFGNPTLPIAKERSLIVDAVENNPSIILSAPTGSGKSIETPQYLLELGRFRRIYSTSPTILTARTIPARIAQELTAKGAEGSRLTGYMTSIEGNATEKNVIVSATDRLILEKIMHNEITKDDIVILDEFHLGKIGTDIALSACIGKGIQTIISSASINEMDTMRQVSRLHGGMPIPIIKGEGRMFPVEQRTDFRVMSRVILEQTTHDLEKGIVPNALCFVSGEKDIRDLTSNVLSGRRYDLAQQNYYRWPREIPIIPLTGESSMRTQAAVMAEHSHGKLVIATNVAETGLTIPNINRVYDTTQNRINIFTNGVNQLLIGPASDSSLEQRMGRTGRTCEGLYIQAPLDGQQLLPRFKTSVDSLSSKEDINISNLPEIQRIDLTDIALRIGKVASSLSDMELVHYPYKSSVSHAEKTLRNFGALHYSSNELTDIGETMATLNLNPNYARMLMAAKKYGSRVETQMSVALASMQVKGLGATNMYSRRWQTLTNEKRSDILAQLDVFIAATSMTTEERESFDIIQRRYQRAFDVAADMLQGSGLSIEDLKRPTGQDREQLYLSVLSGSSELFIRSGRNRFRDARRQKRALAGTSIISEKERYIIGEPLDIGTMTKTGQRIKRGIIAATAVSIETLETISPERFILKYKGFTLNDLGRIKSYYDLYFDETRTGLTRLSEPHLTEETDAYLVQQLCQCSVFNRMETSVTELYSAIEELDILQNKTDQDLELNGLENWMLHQVTAKAPRTVKSINELSKVLLAADIRHYVSPAIRSEIEANAPSEATIALRSGEEKTFSLKYIHNKIYLDMYAGEVSELPQFSTMYGRKVFIRVSGHKKPLTIAEAQEHFGRESRWYRRRHENRVERVTVGVAQNIRADEDPATLYAASIKTNDISVAGVIISHFRKKRSRLGGRRG